MNWGKLAVRRPSHLFLSIESICKEVKCDNGIIIDDMAEKCKICYRMHKKRTIQQKIKRIETKYKETQKQISDKYGIDIQQMILNRITYENCTINELHETFNNITTNEMVNYVLSIMLFSKSIKIHNSIIEVNKK